jgi:ribosome-associated heat shock protein Hsp15
MADRVRLDKWLWAARFFKTRSQASAAIKGGRVDVDGVAAKASHAVTVGTRIEVRKGPYRFTVDVAALADRRGSAEVARTLYTEDPESEKLRHETRARIAAERAARPSGWSGGRPTKKQRRQLLAFRDQSLAAAAPPGQDDDDDDDDDWLDDHDWWDE